jgi:translocation and assembly module TamA
VRWLTAVWGGAVFCDIGDAADNLRDVRLARGYGVGVRRKSTAGPLAFDLAYGEKYKQWRLHFSIAIAY